MPKWAVTHVLLAASGTVIIHLRVQVMYLHKFQNARTTTRSLYLHIPPTVVCVQKCFAIHTVVQPVTYKYLLFKALLELDWGVSVFLIAGLKTHTKDNIKC